METSSVINVISPNQFTALMKAIAGCQVTFTAKIDSLQIDTGLICRDMEKFRNQLTDAVLHLEDTVREHSAQLHTLYTKVRSLEFKAENAEN